MSFLTIVVEFEWRVEYFIVGSEVIVVGGTLFIHDITDRTLDGFKRLVLGHALLNLPQNFTHFGVTLSRL